MTRESTTRSRRLTPILVALSVALPTVGALAVQAGAATVSGVERVSTATGLPGSQGNDLADFPSVSADGRYVAFTTQATTLDPADTDVLFDVYVKDRMTGVLTYVSRPPAGIPGLKRNSTEPVISADGAYVTFTSLAANLVPGDTNNVEDVFRYSMATGAIERVSTQHTTGAEANGVSGKPDISSAGRYVAFESDAGNLQLTIDGNPTRDVFVKDMATGGTVKASVSSGGVTAGGFHGNPSISDSGRVVAFQSNGAFVVPGDTNSRFDIFVHDLDSLATSRVSVTSSGAQTQAANCTVTTNTGSLDPAISGDGLQVAFISVCSDLVDLDTNGYVDVFVHDRATGHTTRTSVDDGGYATIEALGDSFAPAISTDGRFVAFWTYANNLDYTTPGLPGTGTAEVLVRDRAARSITTIAPGAVGLVPGINADGTVVAFSSPAAVVTADTNSVTDVYAATLVPDPLTPLYLLPQQGDTQLNALLLAMDAQLPDLAVATIDPANGTFTFPECSPAVPKVPGGVSDFLAAFAGGPYLDTSGAAAIAVPRQCRPDVMTGYFGAG